MKVLHLTLSKKPFEVMVTGEKNKEYRSPSNWIKSRLIGKGYDAIKFVNGYGDDKPYFIARYGGFCRCQIDSTKTFTNGLSVNVMDGDYIIFVGDIIETGNIQSTA